MNHTEKMERVREMWEEGRRPTKAEREVTNKRGEEVNECAVNQS